ncbi:MAG: 2-C-methyl-D-erythritol 2,4-cyclodiphosphate synthase [Chloroflexota bacterium]
MPRVGIGYDVHPLTAGRKLVLGGIEFEYALGLAGHSDADVLLHAVMDALLGAAGLGDIGQHFPPSDAEYRDISSLELLRRVRALLASSGWHIVNLDTTVVAEAPRLSPRLAEMRAAIASACGLEESLVSIKATTNEGLGFVGHGEGIAALAVALLDSSATGPG